MDEVQGSAPLGSIFGWLDWVGGHTCSGVGWGEALPGLQLLAPRTDKASTATAGPEAWEPGEPRAQAAPTGDRLQWLQMLGEVRKKGAEGLQAPPGHPPHNRLPTSHAPCGPEIPVTAPLGLLPM